MNKLKKTEKAKSKPKQGKPVFRKIASAINVVGYINKNMIVGMMPFMFFLTALCLIYIANSYYAEKTVREIDTISKELKELRSEYITGKSDLMYSSKQSNVAAKAADIGIKESLEPPSKIVVNQNELSQNKEVIER